MDPGPYEGHVRDFFWAPSFPCFGGSFKGCLKGACRAQIGPYTDYDRQSWEWYMTKPCWNEFDAEHLLHLFLSNETPT